MSVEYAIYCRKSTDETSGKQAQSIPDQINACIKYARDNDMTIMEKPKNFSDFESESEIEKEDNDAEISNQRLYKETRNLFIIKEQESAKTPYIRKKWRKLMQRIEKWKVKWLLSYSPDRQARNLVEWWEIINFVDKNTKDETVLDLKYTNFFFEDSASGKMMLWIWFVFSKQYSDKLSEDTTRWMDSKHAQWKALWVYKHWYWFSDEWYHVPHKEDFE